MGETQSASMNPPEHGISQQSLIKLQKVSYKQMICFFHYIKSKVILSGDFLESLVKDDL